MQRYGIFFLFILVLLRTGWNDWKERKIKNRASIMILLLSLTACVVVSEISVQERLLGLAIVSVPMTLIGVLCPGSFGGGDAKFSAVCGAFLGWEKVLEGTVAAVFLAGAYCIWLLFGGFLKQRKYHSKKEYCLKEKIDMQFAFGPFLCIGYLIETVKMLRI